MYRELFSKKSPRKIKATVIGTDCLGWVFHNIVALYRFLPIKWDPILAKVSKFFAKFLSEIPFLFLAGILFNSIWILPNRLPPLFPNFSQIFKESHFTVRTLQRLKHSKIPFYRIPILPRELCSLKKVFPPP